MDLQALFPVQLPQRAEDVTKEDFEISVAQNENNINQNFDILFRAIRELSETSETKEG